MTVESNAAMTLGHFVLGGALYGFTKLGAGGRELVSYLKNLEERKNHTEELHTTEERLTYGQNKNLTEFLLKEDQMDFFCVYTSQIPQLTKELTNASIQGLFVPAEQQHLSYLAVPSGNTQRINRILSSYHLPQLEHQEIPKSFVVSKKLDKDSSETTAVEQCVEELRLESSLFSNKTRGKQMEKERTVSDV